MEILVFTPCPFHTFLEGNQDVYVNENSYFNI